MRATRQSHVINGAIEEQRIEEGAQNPQQDQRLLADDGQPESDPCFRRISTDTRASLQCLIS